MVFNFIPVPSTGATGQAGQTGLTRRRLSFHLRFAASPRHDAEARRIIRIFFIFITFHLPATLSLARRAGKKVLKPNPLLAEK